MQMLELPDLGRLVELHHGAVVAVAYATTRDLALAEDVAQETFVAAWNARERLRDATRVRPWLCGIARNLSRNALRARRRERGGDASDEREDPRPSVVDHAIERETATELRVALAAVPDAYREALVLFYWEGKSIADVAASLGISEEAAQKRISRGRSYLRAELEAPLETAGRGRRSAAAAAAAVLAVLAAKTGVAQAATASKGTTMMMIKGLGALAAAGLVAGTIAVVRSGASDAAPNERATTAATAATMPTAVERPAPTAPARAPALPQAEGAAPAREESMAAARGALPVPASYEITVLAPTSVAVKLAGGTSDAFLFQQPAAPTFDRHITGRVLDGSGKPIGGAVVVVGSRLDAHMGSLFGAGAARSAPDGSFSLITHEDTAGYAIALHPRGWSSVAAVPAGRGDAKIVLTAPAAGTLVMHARQGGTPLEADVTLTPEAGGLVLMLETDTRGELRVPLLAAGTYKLAVRPSQMFAGGSSPAFTREVTVDADRVTDVPVELATGTLVVASAFKPGMETVEYFFYPGTDALDLAALKKRGRGGEILDFLLGGQDADRPAQLHDITPGAYTLCVDAAKSRDDHYPLACRPVTVAAGQATLEINVDIDVAR